MEPAGFAMLKDRMDDQGVNCRQHNPLEETVEVRLKYARKLIAVNHADVLSAEDFRSFR